MVQAFKAAGSLQLHRLIKLTGIYRAAGTGRKKATLVAVADGDSKQALCEIRC
jgi:hypothetical protein